MTTDNWIRTAKLGCITISALLCVLGVVLMAVPDFSATLLCWIGGLLLILFGLVKIIGYCAKDLYRLAFQYDLAFGILLIALGTVLIVHADFMMNVICIFFGICILADALLKIQVSIDSKAFGIRPWWLIFAAALVTAVVGFLLVLRPSESVETIMLLLGMALFTEGILNLVTILTAVKIVRKQKPPVIDAEYCEMEHHP